MLKKILFIPLAVILIQPAVSQSYILDEIIAVVGDKKVLYSELEQQYQQMVSQGSKPIELTRCEAYKELLIMNLMVNQAEIDSLVVTEIDVELELSRRMQYFINQIGSPEKLEKYFNKSILEIKEDMRSSIRDQLLMQKMTVEITTGITITPSEVRNYFKNLPPDSLPYIDAQVEINQIALYPPSSEEAKLAVREELLNLRQRILDGDNFTTLAVLYSEDPGSSAKGGDIGFMSKGELDPEYAKVAFSLKEGQISKIVESSFGFHLIQLIERQDDRVHTRHILMKPKISIEDKVRTREKLDSIVSLIRLDSLTFEQAAIKFSEDENTRMNGGQVVNPLTNNLRFNLDEFEARDYIIIRDLNVGQMSEPYESLDEKGKTIFKVIQLKKRTTPHVANLKDDYSLLKKMALQKKQNQVVEEWIKNKLRTTYIHLNEKHTKCSFLNDGWIK